MAAETGSALRTVTLRGGHSSADHLITEVPCELRYNGRVFGVMMLTPVDLQDFALGFSLSEGIVDSASDIESVTITETLEGIFIELTAPAAGDFMERLLPGRSACGLCGTRRLEDAVRPARALDGTPEPLSALSLQRALAALPDRQSINARTGAAHAAAWVLHDGSVSAVREDVGRHNALDKLLGHLSATHASLQNGFVLVTSRASFEMVSKVIRLGVPTLAAISAPTALAVDYARLHNLQLLAFARDNGFNVYGP